VLKGNSLAPYPSPALASFGIFLSHKGLVFSEGSLPVVMARVRLVTHGVRRIAGYSIIIKAMRGGGTGSVGWDKFTGQETPCMAA